MRNYIKVILFIALIIGIIVSGRFFESLDVSKLKKNGKFTTAKVVRVYCKKSIWLVFELIVEDGKKLIVHENCVFNNCSVFLNKSFPAIYNPDNLKEVDILFRRAKFEEYDMVFPDSLKWVDQYEGLFNL